MARIAFGLTVSISGTVIWLVLNEFTYLSPYRGALLERYSTAITIYGLALAFNLFSLLYWICRRLGLGDAGRKLRKLEKEVHRGEAFDQELAERLQAQTEGEV